MTTSLPGNDPVRPTRTLRWTVLPDGVVGKDADGHDILRVSVLITPLLTGSARLGDYAGMRDWPDTLDGLLASMSLAFYDSSDVSVGTVTSTTPADRFPPADSGAWTT